MGSYIYIYIMMQAVFLQFFQNVFYDFQGSRLLFLVPEWFLWFFIVPGWFFMVLDGFFWLFKVGWFFKVPCWLLFQVGFYGFQGSRFVFHGYKWDFMVFQGFRLVFRGFRWVLRVNHGSRLVL